MDIVITCLLNSYLYTPMGTSHPLSEKHLFTIKCGLMQKPRVGQHTENKRLWITGV